MKKTKNLWGGRFTGKPDETFARFNNSFAFDRRLFAADVQASIAYARGLAGANVLTRREADKLTAALKALLKRRDSDERFFEAGDAEDIHSFIEAKLVETLGDTAKKLHTGRSRNDQVATAFRLWVRTAIDELSPLLLDVQRALADAAERHANAVIPGYTHLQKAQPVMWAHWALAYFEMITRDGERLEQARKRTNVLPLGSGALAGTSVSLDRTAVAKELGFEDVSVNSLDAVSDRDFVIDFIGACSMAMLHLSRLSEDLIIYCSNEFGFVELSDSVSSGSSLMPQKKNPDSLELIRGKAGRVFGHQMAMLTTMKGLPLAYNKDMQEDKEAVFDTFDTVMICLKTAAIVLDNLTVNEERSRGAAGRGYLNATELADYLVQKGVPFRSAHETVGKAVLYALEQDKELHELPIGDLRKFGADIGEDVFAALSLEQTLASKSNVGGTAPARVREALRKARRYLAKRS